MGITLLPVAERELRVASRQISTYRDRFLVITMGVVACVWLFITFSIEISPVRVGKELFSVLSTMAFIYVLLSGTRVTSDCISKEKREGTLGLLFLTDLTGMDVVLGKLAATSTSTFYGLLGILPVIGIPLLMGGVSGMTFAKVVLTLIVTLFFSLSAGILVSAMSQKERSAGGGTFLLIIVFAILIPGIGIGLVNYLQTKYGFDPSSQLFLAAPFMLLSPIFSFMGSLSEQNLPQAVVGYLLWISSLVQIAFGVVFLIAAGRITRKSWKDRPASIRKQRWIERWDRWNYGSSQFRNHRRITLLNISPFLWMAERNRLQFSMLWGFLSLLGVGFFWGYMKYENDWLSVGVAFFTAIMLHGTIKAWAVTEASRRIFDLRRDNAMELILSTPITPRDVLNGYFRSFHRLLVAPIVVILIIDILLIKMAFLDEHGAEDRRFILQCFIAGGFAFVADYYAILWVGMWRGLSDRSSTRASYMTFFKILVTPWLVFIGTLILIEIVDPRIMSREEARFYMLWYWLAVGLITNFVEGYLAWKNLHRQFRQVTFQRYQPQPKSRWTQLFSFK